MVVCAGPTQKVPGTEKKHQGGFRAKFEIIRANALLEPCAGCGDGTSTSLYKPLVKTEKKKTNFRGLALKEPVFTRALWPMPMGTVLAIAFLVTYDQLPLKPISPLFKRKKWSPRL
jgi:hypothetical protein